MKVSVQVGSRSDFANAAITGTGANERGNTHVLGTISPGRVWAEGAWEYVDEALLSDTPPNPVTFDGVLPQDRLTARVNFEVPGVGFRSSVSQTPLAIYGRFENMDTLVLLARDTTDERNVDQDQVKIVDTVAELSVVPSRLDYGCGPSCSNIVVTIDDKAENLNCNEIEYVPFWVIVNPGVGTPPMTRRLRPSAPS